MKDISSISGNDSEDNDDDFGNNDDDDDESDSDLSDASDDDDNNVLPHYAQVARNKPKISFRLNDSNILIMFRCILHGKKVTKKNFKLFTKFQLIF